ncbi:hypothetical protein SPI_09155 [Niveomyces insectorum RCEF 264]|uniref:Uncharacterized protein n=1 Tax=Niveomyces insectorum RCEF 264 TaxID=1081102 RepID=A0A162K6D8_9HYPO|nr:hypothetical protein SPI_09155 [Niveomyces insectorum RCEF 264]
MAITDGDLMYMASAMWDDIELPSPAGEPRQPEDQVGNFGFPPDVNGDVQLSSGNKIEWKRPAKPKCSNATESESSHERRSNSNNMKNAKASSSVMDTAISSPDVSVRPKKKQKLSKSMRGGSQNEYPKQPGTIETKPKLMVYDQKEASAEPVNGADPYSLPLSPISSRRQQRRKPPVVTQAIPTGTRTETPSSPRRQNGQATNKSLSKRPKHQKRIAKRSFLDPPETFLIEARATSEKPVKKEPEEAASATTISAAALRPPENKVAQAPGILSTKLDLKKPAFQADIAKRLRPRGERIPIVISSDSESSDNEQAWSDDVLDHRMPLTVPQSPPGLAKKIVQTDHPSEQELSGKAKTEGLNADIEKNQNKNRPAETGFIRDRPDSDIGVDTVQGLDASLKQHSPLGITSMQNKKNDKGLRHQPTKTAEYPKTKTNVAASTRQYEKPALVNATTISDPFVEDTCDKSSARTRFTARLLNDATGKNLDSSRVLPRWSQASSNSVSEKASGEVQRNSDDIARQMMQLFANAESCGGAITTKNQIQQETAKNIWLEETDPYKDTGHIMGYVCKTVLRFLKSKEAAIDDVANEYLHRGSSVLARIEGLHQAERCSVAQKFEDYRKEALNVFDAAYHDVFSMATKLKHVKLAPAVNDVLADNTSCRLRVLQTEMA